MIRYGEPRKIEIDEDSEVAPVPFRMEVIFQMLEADPEELRVDQYGSIIVDLDEVALKQLLRRNMEDTFRAFGAYISVTPSGDTWVNFPWDLLGFYEFRNYYTDHTTYHFSSEGL